MKPEAIAKPPAPRVQGFPIDDESLLPPMKPGAIAKPPAPSGFEAGGSDPFASLFSDNKTTKPSSASSKPVTAPSGNKESLGDLSDLDLGLLDLFPQGNKGSPARPPSPPPPSADGGDVVNFSELLKIEKKPSAGKQPTDLKKTPPGGKDPFSLEDFDISKFEI